MIIRANKIKSFNTCEILRYFCRIFCLNAVNGFPVENEYTIICHPYMSLSTHTHTHNTWARICAMMEKQNDKVFHSSQKVDVFQCAVLCWAAVSCQRCHARSFFQWMFFSLNSVSSVSTLTNIVRVTEHSSCHSCNRALFLRHCFNAIRNLRTPALHETIIFHNGINTHKLRFFQLNRILSSRPKAFCWSFYLSLAAFQCKAEEFFCSSLKYTYTIRSRASLYLKWLTFLIELPSMCKTRANHRY